VIGGRELNNFDPGPGDSDFAIFDPKWAKKCEKSRSGIRRTAIYGNFLVIAEE
jgi:hypothetical protein